MNRFFGTSKAKAPAPNLEGAITKADERISDLDLKLKKIDAELMRYKEQYKNAREGPSKNILKQRITRALQQRNTYNNQREQIQNQIYTMEQTQFTTETIKSSITTVAAMKEASKQLKTEYKKINVDQIEDLQDELADLIEDSNMIQEALGRGYEVPEEFDDAELEAELDLLGEDLIHENTNEIPSYLQDPALEFNPKPLPEFADELKELENEANENGPMKAN